MNRIVKTYTGSRTKCGTVVNIHYPNRRAKSELDNVQALTAARSLQVVNHSPDGFEWGYGGSGPAQLAMGLLLDVGVDEETARKLYQRFKDSCIAGLGETWSMTDADILEWVERAKSSQPDMFEVMT